MATQWVGPFYDRFFKIGYVGFLIRRSHATKGWDQYELDDHPAQTNVSHADRLNGWCGSYNDVSTYAEGVVKVVKVARNGRLLVEQVTGEALAAYLDEVGYPDLMPEPKIVRLARGEP